MFAGNFAPQGWALCQGQLLSIEQNTALFALIGTTYGGDGQTTFALPDLRGRVTVSMGSGQGLTPRSIGQNGGSETVGLVAAQMPAHSHLANCGPIGTQASPTGNYWSTDPGGNTAAYSNASNSQMAAGAISAYTGGQPHDNVQPFLVINYIIALQGIFPSQN